MSLEEARKKRIEELLAMQNERLQEQMREQIQVQQQVQQIEKGAMLWMDAEAKSRFGNLRLAHPEKALQAAALIAQFVHQGKIHKIITDEQLKELLIYLDEAKQENKIKFARK